MCKEVLFINLNHLAESFSQSVGQKLLKFLKHGYFVWKKPTQTVYEVNTLL